MAKKKKYFLKINGDTMTTVVVFSLLFCVTVIVWGMRQAESGVDSSAIVDSALRVFGTELGICGIMTIFKRWLEQQDKKIEEARERRNKQKEKEAQEKEAFLKGVDNT